MYKRQPLATRQHLAPWLFVAGFVLLALVLIPGIGREVNGARRWLSLGIVNLQPSELMKLFAVLYAAAYTVRKMPNMHNLKKAFLPMAGAMVAVGVLLLKEPDFGAFVVIISIAIGIPVSYTHLDVYKRQVVNGCRAFPASERRMSAGATRCAGWKII